MMISFLFVFFVFTTLYATEQLIWYDNQIDLAFSEARRTNKPMILVFHTKWCPPCNYLNEVVFTDPQVIDLSKKFVALKIDADAQSSFALKSRYAIGGYPTVLFLKPDGSELGRLVGPEKPDAFLKTMQSHLDSSVSIDEVIARLQADKRLGSDLLRLAEYYDGKDKHYEAANAVYTTAALLFSPDPETEKKILTAQTTFFNKIDPPARCLEIVEKLLERTKKSKHFAWAMGQKMQCVKAKDDPELYRKEAQIAIEALLGQLDYYKDDEEALILSYDYLADFYQNTERKELADSYRTNAVILLEKQLGAVKAPPKSQALDLLYFYAELEENEKQEALLRKMVAAYPLEFVFHYHQAKYFDKVNRLEEARKSIDLAEKYAYGDNVLMVARVKAEIFDHTGRTQAAEYLRKKLGTMEVDPQLKVRSHRYISQLKKKIDDYQRTQ